MLETLHKCVVVTGFGPFRGNNYQVNPASVVKDRIPTKIRRVHGPDVHVVRWPNLHNIMADMDAVSDMWSHAAGTLAEGNRQNRQACVDAMLHIGVGSAGGWKLEMRARRDRYDWIGDDDIPLPGQNGASGARFHGMPPELRPMFDVPLLVKSLNTRFPELNIQTSSDAEFAYCEFLLYIPLAELQARGESARVMFLHIPDEGEESLEHSVQIAMAIIELMVDMQIDHHT